MKRLWMLMLAVTLTPGLGAQEQDSTLKQAEQARLRAQIEQRFAERVHDELNLTSDQAAKLGATQERFGARRRAPLRQQAERRRALEDQMEPGVAANADSVKRLMDGMQAGRTAMLKIEQDEDREMAGYLTPVQRARYQQMREQLMRRVTEMRAQRRGGRMGPGMGPGQRARPEGRRPRPGRRPV